MDKYFLYDRTVPVVSFDSKELEGFMYDFMMENISENRVVNKNKSVEEYVGLVLLRLGFKSDDRIELRDRCYKNGDMSVSCVVNDQKYYEIRFVNVGNGKLNTEIVLVDYNEEYTYECVPYGLSEIGIRMFKFRESEMYADGVSYVRELSNDRVYVNLCYEDYRLELDVLKPKDIDLALYDSDWGYSRYRLDNEIGVKNYLLNFFPIIINGDIVSVYKEIVRLSLGDVSRYPEVTLRFSFCDKITDLIHLKYGVLERFGVTLLRMDRALFINRDGSFSYESNDRDNMFNINMSVTDDRTVYNISINNDSDVSMISDIIQDDTDRIKSEIGNIKKLVKDNFDNKNSGSN